MREQTPLRSRILLGQALMLAAACEGLPKMEPVVVKSKKKAKKSRHTNSFLRKPKLR